MDPETSQMEQMLSRLGRAHRDGAFSGDSVRYPWRTGEPEATSFTHRRFAWARIAVPLAAAAAVAVLFLGPALWSPQAVHEVAEIALTTGEDQKPEQPIAEQPVAETASAVECDYNGDGQVDGRDIQAFVERLKDTDGDPDLEVEYLQRCLLGN